MRTNGHNDGSDIPFIHGWPDSSTFACAPARASRLQTGAHLEAAFGVRKVVAPKSGGRISHEG